MKIEGDAISAFEVSHHLDVLKGKILMRKTEKFIDMSSEEELKIHKDIGVCNEDEVWAVIDEFYGNLLISCVCFYSHFK